MTTLEVVGSTSLEITVVHASGTTTASASAPNGMVVIGGGAQAHGSFLIESYAASNQLSWIGTTVSGSTVDVWAYCVTGTVS